MKYFFFYITMILTLLTAQKALAFKFTPEVCREYNLGKNWYCGENEQEDKDDSNKSTLSAKDILDSKMAPEEKAIQLNQLWDTQRKRAVITGDKQEIKQFLETHYLITEKGVGFARNVQQLIDSDPRLAKSESYYKNVAQLKAKEEAKERILSNANNRYGLVFIYSSDCQYCARQLPIIHQFKQTRNFKVMGVTPGEYYFEGLDENITDLNVASGPLVQAWPTILLLDKKIHKKIFITKGLTTLDDLEQKIASRIEEREMEMGQ